MHRFNNPTLSSNFDAVWTLNKQTVILNINNIVTASKLNRTLTEHSSSYLHLLYSLYVAHDVTFCHNNEQQQTCRSTYRDTTILLQYIAAQWRIWGSLEGPARQGGRRVQGGAPPLLACAAKKLALFHCRTQFRTYIYIALSSVSVQK